jgi:YD repeat-containing protein
MGRTYAVGSNGPEGKYIFTETTFDSLGRIYQKSNPYLWLNDPLETIYYTTFTYDGLSRVIDVATPDGYHIGTTYQGLKKVITNQRKYSTAYTYDVYQRLKKVEEPNSTVTEYTYDALGNLTQVIAAKNATTSRGTGRGRS